MGWLIFAAYVVVWLLYGWRLSIYILDGEVQRSMGPYRTAEEAADNWRGISIFGGFGLALFWPVVAPVRATYFLATEGGLFRTPTERAEAQRKELEALRKLAREHGLPMPTDESRKGAA